ncbi:MAG TPA: tetratricopeptide repeat protein [Rhizomicrobium sp.]|nr:tetratricopeptide repeat protein [Rhizomicrobium sp.]
MSAAYQSGLKLSSQGRHVEAIAQFEQALALDPADTKVLFALGNTASQLGLAGAAEQFFRQVLALEPTRLEAIVNLANLLRGATQYEAAIALLEPALARQPESPELLITLGSTFREKGDLPQARIHYQAALAARPNYASALANLADMASDSGERERARTLYDQAVKADPKNPQIRLNRAILHLLNGDLKQGWRDYAARTEVPGKVPALSGEQRLAPWTGGSLKRTRLLVRAEQGVGDQILFASLVPDLAARAKAEGGSVILECEPRLVPLFTRSFPDVTVRPAVIKTLGGVPTADYGWLKSAGGANAAVLMGSLPKYLRGALESFPRPHPFLVPDAQERARWRSVFAAQDGGTKRIIGISWRSGKLGSGDRVLQYAPLQDWARFVKATDATFVCAQYAAADEEIAALQEMSGRKILVPENLDQKNELDRACAMLAALDVVISAPTAVSWQAAGVGVPTLKLLTNPVWTAMGQSHEPFAPACQCLSAAQMGDWADVFRQAREALTALPPQTIRR